MLSLRKEAVRVVRRIGLCKICCSEAYLSTSGGVKLYNKADTPDLLTVKMKAILLIKMYGSLLFRKITNMS